jgi:hypothetical protein
MKRFNKFLKGEIDMTGKNIGKNKEEIKEVASVNGVKHLD